MKLNKLFLMGAIALGLVACNNENVPTPDQGKGGHYLGISLTMSSPSTRATITDDSKPGIATENTLSAASAVVVAFPAATAGTPVVSNVLALASAYEGTTPTYTPKEEAAIEVPAGTYDVYVVVGTSAFADAFKTAVAATPGIMAQKDLFTMLNNLADIDGLTTSNAFVMSSREKAVVTAQATKTAAIATANTAKVNLDRLVAKVTVKKAAAMTVEPTTFTADLANFTLEQGKTAEYTMMQDKSLTNSAAPAGQLPNDWNPLSPTVVAPTAAAEGTSFATALISFKVWGDKDNAFGACPGRATDGGLYTTENTNLFETGNTGYKVGNTTYALIRVKVTPTALIGTAATDGTFYYGLSDYKFYAEADAAAAANGKLDGTAAGTAGNNGYLKYNGGYAYYTVWVGQNYPTQNYAPVVRNRWYELNVTKILQLGTPYDPINPKNPKVPYTPGTDGPNTPPTPPGPNDPIVPEVKYIAAELKVMNWTAVDRDIELK